LITELITILVIMKTPQVTQSFVGALSRVAALPLVALATFCSITAHATPIAVADFSFETNNGNASNSILAAPGGAFGPWDYTRSGVVVPATLSDVVIGANPLATDGTDAATLSFLLGVVGTVSLSQDLGVSALADSIYTLTFDVDQLSLLNLLTAARASITVDGVAVSSLSNGSLLGLLNGTGGLDTVSFQYTTGGSVPTGNLGVEFEISNVVSVGSGIVLDNIRMDVVPVPEPTSALLVGLAGLRLMLRRRRNDVA
jgi:hypothetical protein